MHQKSRNSVQAVKDAPGLILPTTHGNTSSNHSGSSEISTPSSPILLAEKTLKNVTLSKYKYQAYASTPLNAPRHVEQHYTPTVLRDRSLNRRNAPLTKVQPVKRVISLKKQNGNQVEVDSNELNFKIKTLEEIRRGKENKQNKSEVALNNSPHVLPSSEERKPLINAQQKTFRKLKIHRKPKELYSVPAPLKQEVEAPNLTETSATHLVTNGSSKVLPKSSEDSNEVLVFRRNSSDSSPGKRKSDESLSSASKVMKILATSDVDRERVSRVDSGPEGIGETHEEPCPQRPEIQSTDNETSNASSHMNSSTSFNLTQDKVVISQTSVPDIKINGVVTSTSLSFSSSHCHKSERSEHSSNKNECSAKVKNVDSSMLLMPTKSDPSSFDSAGKDNLIDQFDNIDAELDEFLGDYVVNIGEIDATPDDHILLEIAEFLDS
ncbi:unnamed protein product [Larinioides sclopetarius]|uniref:Uncharacterized protein n=1 Tax=Larinioides sclopetarius TaxID=280406 RepID=A0AAV2B582_9ARAC